MATVRQVIDQDNRVVGEYKTGYGFTPTGATRRLRRWLPTGTRLKHTPTLRFSINDLGGQENYSIKD
jgi:hypothetical protein